MDEVRRVPDNYDAVFEDPVKPDMWVPIKIVNKTGHDLKFTRTADESTWFLEIDDPV